MLDLLAIYIRIAHIYMTITLLEKRRSFFNRPYKIHSYIYSKTGFRAERKLMDKSFEIKGFPGIPEPGTPEYEAYERDCREKPPFEMPEGPYRNTGAQFWYEPASKVVQTPKTEIIEVFHELGPLVDGETPIGYDELIERLDVAVQKVGGYPVFFRSGQTSAKHISLEACIVKDKKDFKRAIPLLVERSLMGWPEQSYRFLMVRELIPTEPVFKAYMPITREFRFFVEKGKISHIQPYWLEEAMKTKEPDDPEWREKLHAISMMSVAEKEFLEAETLKIASVCPGDWSVDWLQDKNGKWWMTDMAVACVSYRWQPDFDIITEEATENNHKP